MKSTQPTRSLMPATDVPAAPAMSPSTFVELTRDTVTDDMIRAMLEAVGNDSDLRTTCVRALRPAAVWRTDGDLYYSRLCRGACAGEINRRAARWRRHGDPSDRLYAELVGLCPPGAAAIERPPAYPTAGRPLCWECNARIEPDQEHQLVGFHGATVTVHVHCLGSIDPDALTDPAELFDTVDGDDEEWDGDDETRELIDDDEYPIIDDDDPEPW